MTQSIALDVDECLRLLASHPVKVGRVGFSDRRGVAVLPVNYRVIAGEVAMRTSVASGLLAALDGPVAFEVDDVDPAWEEGWSVLVRGTAREVVEPEEVRRLEGSGLRSWAGAEDVWLAIRPREITGRRLV